MAEGARPICRATDRGQARSGRIRPHTVARDAQPHNRPSRYPCSKERVPAYTEIGH